ncbi:glycerophosphodiester phosphodiesterase [Nocardioides alcanivorans]|uniref:glycerophosphodiester phosphodiesterase n=1 Tax=Nocardioides alcanivorans TaxID=2897352 RepID=UPI001F37E063|nr:glycerophosphodiester phosphodiesterase family protein [Nocardioides alcanivorans]
MTQTGFRYLDEPSRPIPFAHRGGALHPEIPGMENTIAAFRHAVSLGYRYLETDVHATSDGHLVAFHDRVLDRVTDQIGVISELTWSQVGEAVIAGSETVPAFEDLFDAFPEARFNVDIKSPGAVAPWRASSRSVVRTTASWWAPSPPGAASLPQAHRRPGGDLGPSG